jgi:hypothetical protein
MSTAPKPVSADPVHVDSKHYTVEAENDRVRVLRVKYASLQCFSQATTGGSPSRTDERKNAVGRRANPW